MPKTPQEIPPKLHPLTLDEMRELWPKSEDGSACARLFQRYLFTMQVHNGARSTCSADKAQAELGANKVISSLLLDVYTLGAAVKAPVGPVKLKRLNRFSPAQPEKTTDSKKT